MVADCQSVNSFLVSAVLHSARRIFLPMGPHRASCARPKSSSPAQTTRNSRALERQFGTKEQRECIAPVNIVYTRMDATMFLFQESSARQMDIVDSNSLLPIPASRRRINPRETHAPPLPLENQRRADVGVCSSLVGRRRARPKLRHYVHCHRALL